MKRLAFLIQQTESKVADLSLEDVGLLFQLSLMACHHTGDEIESGKILIAGRTPDIKLLANVFSIHSTKLGNAINRLEKADLVKQNPLRISSFYEDNEPYISRRRSNIDSPRRSSAVPNETPIETSNGHPFPEGIGREGKGKERTGEKYPPPPEPLRTEDVMPEEIISKINKDVSPFRQDAKILAALVNVDMCMLYELCWSQGGRSKKPRQTIMVEMSDLSRSYGKDKTNAAMIIASKSDWSFNMTSKILKGEVNFGNKKFGSNQREATVVENILLICPACKKNTLRNASGTSFLCGSCDESFNVPTDMMGIIVTDLPEETQDILKQLAKRKENAGKP